MTLNLILTSENAAFVLIHQYLHERNTEIRYAYLQVIQANPRKNWGRIFLQEAYQLNTSNDKDFKKLLDTKKIILSKSKYDFTGVLMQISAIIKNLDKWKEQLLKDAVLVTARVAAVKLVEKMLFDEKKEKDFKNFIENVHSSGSGKQSVGEFFLQKYYSLSGKTLKTDTEFRKFLRAEGMRPVAVFGVKETEEQIGDLLKNNDSLGDVSEYRVQCDMAKKREKG